ncbi:hypothetical protein AAF712_008703 [Marasmius tenuissimus]|uniref:DUF6697 domain-containing protein n=1 Tax=Marasmius tenuissimus TaxID=585030 RepID=A0ABR2ZSL8_9AGAR
MAKRGKNASKAKRGEPVVRIKEEDNDIPSALDLQTEDEDKKKDLVLVKKEEEMDQELELIRKRVEARRTLRDRRNHELKAEEEAEDVIDPLKAADLLRDILPYLISIADDDNLDIYYAVAREFLAKVFGGNQLQTFPEFAREKMDELVNMGFARHQWACMTADYNTYMPSKPGQPGLFFTERLLNADLTPNYQWTYSQGSCERDMDKRLYHQRGGDESPGYESNFETVLAPIVSLHRAEYSAKLNDTKNKYLGVTAAQVADAFDRGEELTAYFRQLVMWKMTCVAYEKEFQRHIVEKAKVSAKKSKKRKAPSSEIAGGSPPPKRPHTRSSARLEERAKASG